MQMFGLKKCALSTIAQNFVPYYNHKEMDNFEQQQNLLCDMHQTLKLHYEGFRQQSELS